MRDKSAFDDSVPAQSRACWEGWRYDLSWAAFCAKGTLLPEQLSNVLRGNVLASTLKLQLRLRDAIFRAGTE